MRPSASILQGGLLATTVLAAGDAKVGAHNYNLVDPFIGTLNGGNVFAGASLPYGMAKAVADSSESNTGGFATDKSNITGFSAQHDSGSGGEPSQGMFPLSFQTYCDGDVLDNCRWGSKYQRALKYRPSSPKAQPGYFSIGMQNGVDVETTVTEHTALWNFHFPSSSVPSGQTLSPLMVLDLTDLQDSRQNASVTVNPTTGRISGNGTFLPSFGVGSFQSYFCADFKGAKIKQTGVWVNDRAGEEPKELFVNRGYSLFYIQAGGFVRFNAPSNGVLQARMGVSFLDTETACANAETEIGDWDFDRVRTEAESKWKQKFSAVTINPGGVGKGIQTTFFSAIYRTMMSPQNYTGQTKLFSGGQMYFDSYYCTWDQFRTLFPFLTYFDPQALSQMIESYLNIYKLEGWLPDCRMQLCKGYSQGGSNADNVIADAWVKNLTGNIDWDLAYEAIRKDAESEPFDWGVEGRGGLQSWKQVGYIPVDDYDYLGFGPDFHSISRSLEYAYNDFSVATVAKGLGHNADYEKYLSRSANWKNLYKANQKSHLPNGSDTGFVGFFQPRYFNGSWGYQDPTDCSPLSSFCSYSQNPSETFEDSIWEYMFFVPQGVSSLISLLGGKKRFVERLEYLHNSGLNEISNEPSLLTVFQYHWAGRPGLSSVRAHSYIPQQFSSRNNGLPGNDDSGTYGSWLALTMSGLFPNAGQNVYLIIPPFFESVSWTSPISGKTATVKNVNFDAGYKNIYIQNATLNGKAYTKNWIGHEFFLQGQTLELTLGPKESKWGTQDEDLPPSSSAAGGQHEDNIVFDSM